MKKNKKIIIIILVILAVALIAYFVFFRKKPTTPAAAGTGTPEPGTTAKGSVKNIDPAPQFPIKKGSQGDNVKLLQKFLNLNNKAPFVEIDVDGYFATATEAALLRTTGKKEVSEADFNGFLNKIPIIISPFKPIFNGL